MKRLTLSLAMVLMVLSVPASAQELEPNEQAYVDAMIAHRCEGTVENEASIAAASGLSPAGAQATRAAMLDWGLLWQDGPVTRLSREECMQFEREEEIALADTAIAWMEAQTDAQAADWFAAIMRTHGCLVTYDDAHLLTRGINTDLAAQFGMPFDDILTATSDRVFWPFFDASDVLVARAAAALTAQGGLSETAEGYQSTGC